MEISWVVHGSRLIVYGLETSEFTISHKLVEYKSRMKNLKYLEQKTQTWYLLGISVVFFLLRFPSFFEPLWDTDSSIYSVIGMSLRHGRLLYSGIWDNKPPLLYYIYGFFSGDAGGVRILSFILGIATLWIFYFLAQSFVSRKTTLWITAIFTLLLGTPIFEANTANAENFILPLVLLAVLFYVKVLKTEHIQLYSKVMFAIGFLVGIAFMIKVVVVFDFIAILLMFILSRPLRTKKEIQKILTQTWPLCVGFIMPLALFCIYFLIRGTFSLFFLSIFLSNITYVGFANNLFVPYGLLIMRIIMLMVAFVILFKKRKALGSLTFFLSLWCALSLFELFFSDRNFAHYVLLFLPSVLLFCGVIWEHFFETKKPFVISLISACILMSLFFHPQWFIGGYYGNFVKFISGGETVEQYQMGFDKNLPADYAVAGFLNTQLAPQDQVVVWGDKPQLYLLLQKVPVGRLSVVYHTWFIPDAFSQEGKSFAHASPRFVIVYPDQIAIPYSLSNYANVFTIQGITVYEKNTLHNTK